MKVLRVKAQEANKGLIKKGLVPCCLDCPDILRERESTEDFRQGNNMIAFEENHNGGCNVEKGLLQNED